MLMNLLAHQIWLRFDEKCRHYCYKCDVQYIWAPPSEYDWTVMIVSWRLSALR